MISSGVHLSSVMSGTALSSTILLKLLIKIGESFKTILLLSMSNCFLSGSDSLEISLSSNSLSFS